VAGERVGAHAGERAPGPGLASSFRPQAAEKARRYRTIQIQAGPHTITAADSLPDDLRQAIEAINHAYRPEH
jgi:hypothetical protein